MKNLKYIFTLFMVTFLFYGCENGYIDAITQVDPGADASAPQITITFPVEGTRIQVVEVVSSIDIEFEVTDDIEIGSISVLMDGSEIANFTEFKDYRRALQEFTYDNITSGDHVLTVTATDIEGKSTSSVVNFSKDPPYTPLFDGEVLYMPFDGTYIDLVSITDPTEVGSPGFAGESFIGTNSYKATTDSYLTFPVGGMFGNEFSAAFWYKVDSNPDRAGLLVIGDDEDRKQGFRLFREGSTSEQRIKLNVGTGTGESWNDGDVIDVAAGEWVHVAFTISPTQSVIYFNGMPMNTGNLGNVVDWTGADTMTIGAGGETFSYWNHLSDNSAMDELRLFNKTLSQSDIQNMIDVTNPYEPLYDGETFYMPFNGSNVELVNKGETTEVGSPGFAGEGVEGGNAYAGATDSYLTLSTDGLLGDEFSAAMWYKVNAEPDRGAILVIGPEDTDNPDFPVIQNKRTSGFRFFREGGATNQIFKLNVGNGNGENWFDGGGAATIDPTTNTDWVHLAFTISGSECTVYIDGEVVSQGAFPGVDWTGCDIISIMSGAPRFTQWGHLSDLSYLDELRLFNKALSQTEIQDMMN